MHKQNHRLHTAKSGRKLAYHLFEGDTDKRTVIFLGGFKSDMEGTKALFLQNLCARKNISFIRFDYSGHGKSEGKFENGSIGQWFEDSLSIIDNISGTREYILVGSSMGGWISLLCARERANTVKGMVLLAPAPDFTREIIDRFDNQQKSDLEKNGYVDVPNDYSDEPYIFTKKLIEDGEDYCLLNSAIDVTAPVIIIQGKKDNDVPWEKALKIQECLTSDETDIILIKDAGHSLSRDKDLKYLEDALSRIIA